MDKNRLISSSIFCLALSLVISASLISKGMQLNGEYLASGLSNGLNTIGYNINNNNTVSTDIEENSNLTFSQAKDYLGLSDWELTSIIKNEQSNIPYISIGDTYIFSKNALDKWIEESRLKM